MDKKTGTDIRKKVLLVEDEDFMLEALRDKFKLAGFHVFLAKNGLEGLERTFAHHPDIIILDILMPKMDGIAMLKNLKDDLRSSGIPVIILTNISDYKQLEEAMKLGASEYMIKADWSLKDVVKHAEKLVEKKSSSGGKKDLQKC